MSGITLLDSGRTRFYSMDRTSERYLEEVHWYGEGHSPPANHQLWISVDGQGQQRTLLEEHPVDVPASMSEQWEEKLLVDILALTPSVAASWADLVAGYDVLLCEEDMLGDTEAIHIELQLIGSTSGITTRQSLWVDVERGFALLQHGKSPYRGRELLYGTVVRATELSQVGDDLWLPQRSVSVRYEGSGPPAEAWRQVATRTLTDMSVDEPTNGEVIDLLASGVAVAASGYEVRLSDDNAEEAARRKSISEVLAASAAGDKPELLPIPAIELDAQRAQD